MEGHPKAFSKQTNCFSSPLARETWSFLDRRRPPRKCRLSECSPGETWYTMTCLGLMAPTFELSRKTLTTPPSPIAGLERWPRPSRDAARAITRVGNAGQIRFGARHNRMVAPSSSSMPCEVSPPQVAATPSDLSRSWFIILSYTGLRRKNSNRLMKLCPRMLGRRGDDLRTRTGQGPYNSVGRHNSVGRPYSVGRPSGLTGRRLSSPELGDPELSTYFQVRKHWVGAIGQEVGRRTGRWFPKPRR